MADQIIENGLRDKLNEIWACEAVVYMPSKYAGAADCIGVYENKETIIDFKQSNKPKKDEWIEDYYLQCAAYALAHDTVHGSNITQAVILLCNKRQYVSKVFDWWWKIKKLPKKVFGKSWTILCTKDGKLNYVVYDLETDSAQLDWATIVEIGAVLLDENLKEKDRFSARCQNASR